MSDRPRPLAPLRPEAFAVWSEAKMGKATLFSSERLLVGLNAFLPGQEHALHAHEAMDKLYQVISGEGVLLLDGAERPLRPGELVIAPAGAPHGIRNTGRERLLVLAVLAPGPGAA